MKQETPCHDTEKRHGKELRARSRKKRMSPPLYTTARFSSIYFISPFRKKWNGLVLKFLHAGISMQLFP